MNEYASSRLGPWNIPVQTIINVIKCTGKETKSFNGTTSADVIAHCWSGHWFADDRAARHDVQWRIRDYGVEWGRGIISTKQRVTEWGCKVHSSPQYLNLTEHAGLINKPSKMNVWHSIIASLLKILYTNLWRLRSKKWWFYTTAVFFDLYLT